MNQRERMMAWYTESLKTYGVGDYRSLTWGSADGSSAKFRYDTMNSIIPFLDKSIIEFGCGWGSFFNFGYTCKSYHGIDINDEFIKIASENYKEHSFEVLDILESKINKKYDLAISSGVAGNQGGPADHPTKLKQYLQCMYDCSDVVMVNFPSTWATIRSNNIEYFSPSSTLEIALSITQNVTLVHKSKFDFLIILSK
jgi:hypothetical protein